MDAKTSPTAMDLEAYKQPGDPVRAIHQEACALEEKRKRIDLPAAAKILFEHWGKVFRDGQSREPMTIKDASEKHPGMLTLHMALRGCYRRLLKRARKDTPEHRRQTPGGRKLSDLLPRNLDEALRLSDKQDTNAELGGLVRLGKVVHYSASEGQPDRPRAVSNWPGKLDDSRFWTSDGQSEIKRAEAFVRIWRQTLVLAGLTLKDWISMKVPFEEDVLGGNQNKLDEALAADKFDRAQFQGKLSVLFGSRAASFSLPTDLACFDLLRGLVGAATNLRHAAFHFKGRGQLLDELTTLPTGFSNPVRESAQRVWQADEADRTARLIAVLRAAHVEHFLDAHQLAQIFAILGGKVSAELPLPRFARVLQRAKDAWASAEEIKLPEPANRRALEVPSRLCQYTVLKLIYERPFRSWLKMQRADAVSAWIDDAVGRATEAAKGMNAKGDETGRKVIAARAANLPKPPAGGDIVDFFFDLSAATASEMRVQRGYESDGEKAREQAEYIDHLLCDVVILALSSYLSEQKLGWILDLRAETAASEQRTCMLEDHETSAPALDAEDWQAALYLLLHLAPVESVGRLLHQLAKWNVTATRESELPREEEIQLRRLIDTMTLYLDMHDAKFEGGAPVPQHELLQELFESPAGLNRVFPRDPQPMADQRIPRRGLREVMRFGHVPLLKSLAGDTKVDDASIARIFAAETPREDGLSQIATWQHRREQLHEQWVEDKYLDEAHLREYCEILSKVSKHRQDSNFVNLVDHVRAHRMIMAIIGRLVDYAGLFERDLYFATLALLHRRDLRPEQVFEERGLRYLFNGQIIFALREHKRNSPEAAALLSELARHFSEVWTQGNPLTRVRNDLAHLNMLRGSVPTPRLTFWVNQTRHLMAYDRKLKNAVSKSVIELVAREGMELRWSIRLEGDAHELADAELSSRRARHLGGKRLTLADAGPKPRAVFMEEGLHGDGYVGMMAAAFGGRWRKTISIEQNLAKVDWKASAERRRPPQESFQVRPRQPSFAENKRGEAPH